VAGWLVALPVPVIIYYANSWNWIVISNILLGVNQALTWPSTVVMKTDLIGFRQRGRAMGINELLGYVVVGSMAYPTEASAKQYGYRDTLFFVGIVLALIGLALSYFLLKDTHQHVQKEQEDRGHAILESVIKETTCKNPGLGSITQAGLVNNLNDGLVWDVLPVLLIQLEFNYKEIGKLVAVFPLVWGFFQVITCKLSDHLNKKYMLVFGMLMHGVALARHWQGESFNESFIYSVLRGLATAIVFPTFLSAISANFNIMTFGFGLCQVNGLLHQ
jgi:MFS family permease